MLAIIQPGKPIRIWNHHFCRSSLTSVAHGSDTMKQESRGLMVCVVVTTLVILAACQESAPPDTVTPVRVVRMSDPVQLMRGQALFAQHCAVCHGTHAQGDGNWRQRNPDGRFPPPPLNGTGHAWHHPHDWLKEMIRNGSMPQGNMPAWGNTLNEQQIEDLIAWFQSLWPDEVYAAWYEMEQRRQGATLQ